MASSVQQVVIESGFSYVRATSLYGWFEGMAHITDLDLTTLATANVTDMSRMFSGCASLVSVTADVAWSTAAVTASADMFSGCTSIVGQDGTTYDSSVVDKTKAHYSAGGYLRGVLHPYVVLCKDGDEGTLYFLTETSAFADATTYTPSGSDTPRTIDAKFTEADMGDANTNPGWITDSSVRPYIYHTVFEPSFASVSPTSLRAWFYNCTNLEDLTGLENLNSSQVTTMLAMFEQCGSLETLDLSLLDVSNVTNMSSLFSNCFQLKSINMAGWNTSNVREMNNMFASTTYEDYTLKKLDISSFDTHNVTDMGYMFASRRGLKTIYVGEGWSTEGVVGQYPGGNAMFNRCDALIGQDGTTYNQYNISADYAHYGTGGYLTLKPDQGAYAIWCGAAETLYFTYSGETYVAGGTFTPAGSNTPQTITAVWYDKEVTDYIHYGNGAGTPKWTSVIINNDDYTLKHVVFEPSFANVAVGTTRYWFASLRTLEDISGIEYLNTSAVTDMSCMFQLCTGLQTLDLSQLNTATVTNMSGMFNFCSSLQTIDVSGLNTANVTNMSSMFAACNGLTALDLSTFNTAKVTDMSYMFDGNNLLTTIDLSSFNTAAATNMAYMFAECPVLNGLDLSGFNTANVTDMNNMFKGCYALTALDLSSFNTAKVTNMSAMFYDCSSLQSLDLSNFTNGSLANWAMDFMFLGCSSLTDLDLSHFSTTDVTSMRAAFSGCSSLTTLDLSAFNTSHVANMFTMFSGCTQLQSIFVGDGWNTESLSERIKSADGYVNGKADLFKNCTSLIGQDGTTYDASATDATKAHYNAGGYLRQKSWTVTIPASGIGTFSADKNVTIPEGLTAYTCTTYSSEAGTMATTAINGGVIPAGTGVLLRGTAGEAYTLTATTDDAQAISGNALVAVTMPTHVAPIDGDYTNFMLKSGKFIRIADSGLDNKMPANKAYLQIPSSAISSGAREFTLIWDDDPTGIENNVQSSMFNVQSNYDLSGRRVKNPVKGGIYILTGKKVLF